eukprot:CAMPEP_0182440230 /NCGR_PEP_ID=MMETSP1167-20130531/86925_1 /TAXON_ID=2988 /ORGANISM="Mallomonas Sp, Strain CCMP3275" /LENGTH=371 /DNA_ID=CAMNT_0024634117 /DNA_START=1682 /DNA_END=2797 /DNA_ORIENTATION=-
MTSTNTSSRSPSPGSTGSELRSLVSSVLSAHGKGHDTIKSGDDTEKRRGILMHLLADAQVVMVDVLVEALSILWKAKPEVQEYTISLSTPPLPLSSRIFFRISPWCGLVEGTVTAFLKHNSTSLSVPTQYKEQSVGYSAVLSDGSHVAFIPISDIAYTTPPLFPFCTVESLESGQMSSEQAEATSLIMTSAHLVNILQFCVLYAKSCPSTESNTSELTASALQQLASWAAVTYVTNAGHLCRGFPDVITMREQLVDVRLLLLQRLGADKKTSTQSQSQHLPSGGSGPASPLIGLTTTSLSSTAPLGPYFLEHPEWLELVKELLMRLQAIAVELGISLSKTKLHDAHKEVDLVPSTKGKGRGLRQGPQYQET